MATRFNFLLGRSVSDPPKRKNPEAAVGRAVDAFLKASGAYVRQVNSGGVVRGGRYTNSGQGAGISDRIGVLPSGRFIAIELKAPGKKRTVTPSQILFLVNIAQRGGVACVADSAACVELAMKQTKEEMLAALHALIKVPKHSPSSKAPLFP